MKSDYTANIAYYLCLTLFVHCFSNYTIPALQALTTPLAVTIVDSFDSFTARLTGELGQEANSSSEHLLSGQRR
ncbi:MAG: hypothetical protein CLLPBCKN_006964 [Chroococcidiopsis cubana SAG 39.79]|uniref:Uncharacterized protein n=1 Tax=Chroococcidiopsis cubana SAG 39.79 TaxID=388085 RepID=A0AB37U9L1_9CYAN|nr:hypothetical protein [Chroococcidiopsis cubana]MDZ4877529.1 hypothetical protein [Chroococcidiopsis cubana SAG 39.79]RUT01164.1 hypothetical protein DSM107010_66070 [Chroococcidiopsis cubana SAG 39.79]